MIYHLPAKKNNNKITIGNDSTKNWAFPQNFHTEKLGEIKVFYAVSRRCCVAVSNRNYKKTIVFSKILVQKIESSR